MALCFLDGGCSSCAFKLVCIREVSYSDRNRVKRQTEVGLSKRKDGRTNDNSSKDSSAVKVACEALGLWDSLWDANPLLLATVLDFLETVWRHALEHKGALEPTRTDVAFGEAIAGIAGWDLGPGPEWATMSFIDVDGQMHSDSYIPVQIYAYRTNVKHMRYRSWH